MTRLERCELLIKRGYTYDPETGNVYSRLKKQVTLKDNGYIRISTTISYRNNISIYAHQFAWYWVNKECVEQLDHINCIRDDNRIINLRPVNNQQNSFNRSTSKGYYKTNNKYRSQITINNKTINLGYFNAEEEARQAYLAAKQIYHVI